MEGRTSESGIDSHRDVERVVGLFSIPEASIVLMDVAPLKHL